MVQKDLRWTKKFQNYKKALAQLRDAVELMESRQLSNLEKQGVVHAYEYTHELAWMVLKDFLLSRGNTEIYGSRDATKAAFRLGVITDGETWMQMIKSRNLTSHTYNESTVEEIIGLIKEEYYQAFEQLKQTMNEFERKELT